jgi:hypothetical protein
VAHREPTLSAATITGWVDDLAEVSRDLTDADRVDQIAELETLKAAAAAAQARLTADLDASQRQAQTDAGLPARRVGTGIASQVALARRESPHLGQRHLGLAKTLVHEMPHTLRALERGRLGEWQATLLARETGHLSLAHRRHIDRMLAGNPEALEGLGTRQLVAAARNLALKLDPEAVVRRNRKAEKERRVGVRPAPDTMTWLSALLPVAQGVAAYAALSKAADQARAAGDPRSRGQVMADTLVARLTGQQVADATPVAVTLTMTDTSLFDGDPEPGHVDGHGPVPAQWARDLIAHAIETGAGVWLRRLFTHPDTGRLVGMDSKQRRVPDGLAALIRARDGGVCRTPYCDAPIRHTDHTVPDHAGGETSEPNLGGRCEYCNHAKEAPGWRARPGPSRHGPHTIEHTTPTGHRHRSHAPPLPGVRPSTTGPSRAEVYLTELLLDAA